MSKMVEAQSRSMLVNCSWLMIFLHFCCMRDVFLLMPYGEPEPLPLMLVLRKLQRYKVERDVLSVCKYIGGAHYGIHSLCKIQFKVRVRPW